MSSRSEAGRQASFGTWESPISKEILSSANITLQEVAVNESTGRIYTVEGRPAEGGRCCIVEYSEGKTRDVLPKEYSSRTYVHGYGGASMATCSDGQRLIFSDWQTKGIFSLNPTNGEVTPVINAHPDVYYADFNVHPTNAQLILAIMEDHRSDVVTNTIVAIDASKNSVQTIKYGADFYAHPQFNLAGSKICWTEWNHPDMPWTGTELYVAEWQDKKIVKPVLVAGKPGEESMSQPRWGPDGTLFFASDRTGYWQLHRWDAASSEAKSINLRGLESAEFAGPEWLLGSCTYVNLTSDTIIAACTEEATNRLVAIGLKSESYTDLKYPLVDIRNNAIQRISKTTLAVIGSTPTSPTALYYLDITKKSEMVVLKMSANLEIPTTFYSEAQHISFPRIHGEDQDGEAHTLFLPPKNPNYDSPKDKLPPLIVSMHGGPTGHVTPGLSLAFQYYTTRGYAFAAVNYAGSSGYGRAYRNRLNSKWGISDVADAASCVALLAKISLIDPKRVGVVGGSAGGYGTLQSLCVYPDVWAGGVSLYGISDVKALVQDTHKFESRYAERLLFSSSDPSDAEKEEVFQERSPLHHAANIKAAILLLQGDEDIVVPPNQALEMAEVVKKSGGEAKVVVFEGEGHGFRKAETVKRAIEEQELWWKKTLLGR